jgi:hypothetical protein
VQASDAGVYDFIVFGNNWVVSPKISVSVQITNGMGVFQPPMVKGTNFTSDLVGVAGRQYDIQSSTNLSTWSNLMTLSNATGTITFSNALNTNRALFYRAKLLP